MMTPLIREEREINNLHVNYYNNNVYMYVYSFNNLLFVFFKMQKKTTSNEFDKL